MAFITKRAVCKYSDCFAHSNGSAPDIVDVHKHRRYFFSSVCFCPLLKIEIV